MQKIFLILTLILAFALAPSGACEVAHAEETQYVEIVADDAAFLNGFGETLFILPKSYFAKYLGTIGEGDSARYEVFYQGARGLVSATSVSAPQANATVDEVGASPNLSLTLSADSTFNEYSFASATASSENVFVADGLTFSYFGTKTEEQIVYLFVRASNGKYGTIPQTAFNEYSLPAHKVTLDRIAADEAAAAEQTPVLDEQEPTEPADGISSNKTVRILLIVGIAVPSVLVVILLFKPQKKSRRRDGSWERNRDYDRAPSRYGDYDEDDYRPNEGEKRRISRHYTDRYDD